jgi:hypothetical protein
MRERWSTYQVAMFVLLLIIELTLLFGWHVS